MNNQANSVSESSVSASISAETKKFLDGPMHLFIDGAWQAGAQGKTLVTSDPATEQPICSFAVGGEKDVLKAIGAARKAFDNGAWSRSSGFGRATIMRQVANLIEKHAQTFAELEVLDNGMPINLAHFMTSDAVNMFNYYAGWAERIEGTTTEPPAHVSFMGEAITYTLREPIGVVGQIIPWNVPLSMAVLKLAPALAAGCTVVLKPSEETPLSAILLCQLLEEAGVPAGVVNMVNGTGIEVGQVMVNSPDVDKIAFTGSTPVGKSIIKASAKDLKKISLELGGKSPVVVFDDANMETAVPGVAMATFFLQGQNCMAGTRIFLHDNIHDVFVEKLKGFVENMHVGNGFDPLTQIGPLISAKQKERVEDYIKAGLEQGATMVTGDRTIPDKGYFVAPTIFTNTKPGMRIVDEEIFGPVMAIQRFSNDDIDAIAQQANNSNYGLSGSVWTQNLSRAHRMASRIRSGHVSINCHGAVASNIPFGGYKQSGWGREFGKEGMDLYLETKAITALL